MIPELPQPEDCDVVLVDDHPLLAAGLKAMLADRHVTLAVAPVLTEDGVIDFVAQHRPKVVLLDYHIPPLGVSTNLVKPLARSGPAVLILTGSNDTILRGQLISLGACAILGKDETLTAIIDAVCDVLAGRSIRIAQSSGYRDMYLRHQADTNLRMAPFAALSTREASVLWALCQGQSPGQIARADFVSVDTVRSQMKSAFRKLGVNSQLEAVVLIRDSGWQR